MVHDIISFDVGNRNLAEAILWFNENSAWTLPPNWIFKPDLCGANQVTFLWVGDKDPSTEDGKYISSLVRKKYKGEAEC